MMRLAVAINDPEHKLSSALISLFTRSHAYHVEPVFSDGATFCCSPKFMGKTNRKYDHYHWILIPCPFVDEDSEKEFRVWCEELNVRNVKYDWLGAISGLFGSSREDSSKWFCGELCVKAFGKYIPELEKLKWATPEKVWKIVANYVDQPSLTK